MRNVLKSIVFVFILFLLVQFFTIAFVPGNSYRKYGIYKVAAYEILGEEEDTIDVVALGDSLVYSSLSPMEIWNQYGYTVFDSAEAAQIISSTYDNMKVAIESQHPKIIIMEANVLFRDSSKKKVENKLFKKVEYYFPITKYHNNWKKYISFGKKRNWSNIYKGYKFITKVDPSKPIKYMSGSKKKRDILSENIQYFEDIVKLCEENNIKLVLVAFPTQNTWSSKKHNAIIELQEKYGFEFLDLNLVDIGIDWTTDTKDIGSHLNYKGAKKVSNYIGNYLQSTGLLDDHRDEEKYELWNKSYKQYYKNHKEFLSKDE